MLPTSAGIDGDGQVVAAGVPTGLAVFAAPLAGGSVGSEALQAEAGTRRAISHWFPSGWVGAENRGGCNGVTAVTDSMAGSPTVPASSSATTYRSHASVNAAR